MVSGRLDGVTELLPVGPPLPAAPLVVVTAHRGSGKTALLHRWSDDLVATGDRAPVWLPIEPGHDDPARFGAWLERLISPEAEPGTIFIDDFERVRSAQSRALLVDAVERSSGATRFVVAQLPGQRLPVARLRADGLVAEIGDQSLRFDERDLDRLATHHGVPLDQPSRSRLLADTEGWAKGLVTVIERLAASPDEPGVMTTTLDRLGRELVDAIRAATDADDFGFLVRSSILEEVDADLYRVVAGPSAELQLDRLAAEVPFVERVSGHPSAVRLHGLARRGLRLELTDHEPPEVTAGRHHRVANWFEASGDLTLALDHALAAGEPERSADLLAARWSADASSLRVEEVDAVAAAGADRYPPHLLTGAILSQRSGDVATTERMVARLDGADWVGPVPHGVATLESAVVALRSGLPRHHGRAELERVVDVVGRDEIAAAEPQTLVARMAAAWALYRLGRIDEARSWADDVLLGHRSLGRHTTSDRLATVWASDLLALIESDLGNRSESRRHLGHGGHLVDSYGLGEADLPPTMAAERVLVRAVAGGDPAVDRIRQLAGLVEDAAPTIQLHAALELVRVLDAERDVRRAAATMEQARAMVDDAVVPPLLAHRLDLLEASLGQVRRGDEPPINVTIGERSVLYLLADRHLAQADIGDRLDLSINTVKSHLRSIYQKFGVTGRAAAVSAAAERGLLVTVRPWGRAEHEGESSPGVRPDV